MLIHYWVRSNFTAEWSRNDQTKLYLFTFPQFLINSCRYLNLNCATRHCAHCYHFHICMISCIERVELNGMPGRSIGITFCKKSLTNAVSVLNAHHFYNPCSRSYDAGNKSGSTKCVKSEHATVCVRVTSNLWRNEDTGMGCVSSLSAAIRRRFSGRRRSVISYHG